MHEFLLLISDNVFECVFVYKFNKRPYSNKRPHSNMLDNCLLLLVILIFIKKNCFDYLAVSQKIK